MLTHPRKAAGRAKFFTYTATVKTLDASGVAGAGTAYPAAYEPAAGAVPEALEMEGPTRDKIFIASWLPELTPKLIVVLTKGAWRRRFEIADVLPVGTPVTQTLLIVNPV